MVKSLKMTLVMSLLFSSLFFVAPRAEAACVQTSSGLRCTNDVLYEDNVKVYYSKNQVKAVLKRHKFVGSNPGLLIGYALAMTGHPAGLSVLMYQIGSNNVIKQFEKAAAKGTGLEISYKVTVYKGSNALTKVSGTKYKYK